MQEVERYIKITETDRCEMKKEKTFIVKIRENQYNTWQGCVHWVNEDKKCNFRSLFEMIRLMDEAIRCDREGVSSEDVS